MTRKRDKFASWLGLPSQSPKPKGSPHNVPRAETGAEGVGSSVDTKIGTATEPDAGSKSDQAPDPEQDTDNGLQDRDPQPLWQEAWDSLPHSDRQLIETVTQNSGSNERIFSDLERIAHQRKQDLHDRNWDDKNQLAGKDAVRVQVAISRIITCLRRFKEVGDIAVNFDPAHAALPWAAFRFVLEALTVNDEQRELLFSGLERVSFLGLRVRVYEQLYLSGTIENENASVAQLKQALVPLCREMLIFLATAVKRFSKTIIAHTIAALFDPSAVSDLLTSINFRASQADIEASNCERFLHLEDRKKLHNLVTEELINIDARIEGLWVRLLETERSELLQWLSSIHYASDHDFAKSGRVVDTGSWLLKRRAFRQWEESNVSEIFWLHGIPGAGKTKLTSKVIDYAQTRLDKSRNKEALVYFYCDRNRSDHRDPPSIIRSFIRQLSADTDNDEDVCKIVDEHWRLEKRKGFPSKDLAFETCKEFLPMLVAAHAKTIMVLDGLDECDRESRHELIYLLKKLTDDPSCLVKVFISSREDRDLFKTFISRTHLRVQANDNHDDIETYVLAQLQNTSNSWFLEKLSPGLRASILQNFSDKSDGMFQWAVLQMHDLLKLKRASDVEAYLGSLPKGLQKAYQRILDDIGDQAGSAPVIAARALKWIMDSAVPLSPKELVAAVCQSSDGLVPHDLDIDAEFVLDACHNLVVITGLTCRFSHLSVQEYLESHDWPNKPDDQLLGAVCLHLLMASEDIILTNELNKYATYHWYKHFKDCDPEDHETTGVTAPLLSKFLGNPTNSSYNYVVWVSRFEAWGLAPGSIDPKDLQPSRSAAFGVVALGLLATVARWIRDGTLDPSLSSSRSSLLHLAVKSGNLAMCSQLVEAGADVNHSTVALETPLLRAVLDRRYSIIELLAKQPRTDVDKGRGRLGNPALYIAVAMGDCRIVELLLSAGGNPDVTKEGALETPLLRAVLNRRYSIIELLAKQPRIDVDKGRDINGAPALCNAVVMGDCRTVELLLSAGGNPDLMEEGEDTQGPAYNGFTPALHVAASEGMINIVRALIQGGANVNLVAGTYQTPLANAVYKKHEAVVHCLIQNGADVNLFRPLYHVIPDVGRRSISKTCMALVNGGALDHVIDLPLAKRTTLDESYANMVNWLDEQLAKSDKERRKRRFLRMFNAGAFRTLQGKEQGGSARGGSEKGYTEDGACENLGRRSVCSL